MKKISFFTFILVSFLSTSLFAQDNTKRIAIPGFSSDAAVEKSTILSIQQRVIDAFVSNKKFTVVERNQTDLLNKETNLQKTEQFMEGKGNVSDKVANTGAQYILTGVISRIEYSSQERDRTEYDKASQKNVKVGTYRVYYCTIEMNLKIIDVTTTQIVLSKVLTVTNNTGSGKKEGGFLSQLVSLGSESGATTESEAYNLSLQQISKATNDFTLEAFPNVLVIAEITKRSGNSADEVLISGDFTDGMRPKQTIFVKKVTEKMVGNKKLVRKETIGELKIIKIEDGGFITCDVKKGGEEIATAFDGSIQLIVTDKE
jgi:curli biogenesis system outer membrane secretion channel CsgG